MGLTEVEEGESTKGLGCLQLYAPIPDVCEKCCSVRVPESGDKCSQQLCRGLGGRYGAFNLPSPECNGKPKRWYLSDVIVEDAARRSLIL